MFLYLFVAFVLSLILLIGSAVKWSLPPKKYIIIILASTILSFAVYFFVRKFGLNEVLLAFIFLITQVLFYVGIILFLFFRDPQRTPPNEKNVLVSPADGTVIYIKKIPADITLSSEKKGRKSVFDELRTTKLGKQELLQVGISLLFTDVHINRAPMSGVVTLICHKPGKFLSLRNQDAIDLNERQTILIENDDIAIGLVQIASRLVRRIESYIKQNEKIEIGQKIGMIKFGSQVDIFIPYEKIIDLRVKVGQYLYAGETIIAVVKKF